MRSFKAQNFVEFGLVIAFAVIIAVVAFSPIGGQIKNSLDKMASQKNLTVDNATLDKITGSSANTTTLTTDIAQLQNSSDSSSKEAASIIKNVLQIASLISSAQNSSISNDNVKTIAKALKTDSNAETSGSLASIIAVNVGSTTLSASDTAALSEVKTLLSGSKISLNTSSENITTTVNALVSLLSALDTNAAKELLSYDLSPVNSSTTDISAVLEASFNISASTEDVSGNIVNTVLLAENILSSKSASAELKTAAQTVIDSFKTTLKL